LFEVSKIYERSKILDAATMKVSFRLGKREISRDSNITFCLETGKLSLGHYILYMASPTLFSPVIQTF